MAQPIDYGKPVQLTNFPSGNVLDYRWHGAALYVSRGSHFADLVMIRDFR